MFQLANVIHVSSVFADRSGPEERYFTLRVSPPPVPRPPHDAFTLNLCRAAADAIIQSAQNLRDEPNLRGNVGGIGLRQWRAAVLSKMEQPTKLVLTSGSQPLDFGHLFFRCSEGPIHIYTSAAATPSIINAASAAGYTPQSEHGLAQLLPGHSAVTLAPPANASSEAAPVVSVTVVSAAPEQRPSLAGAIAHLNAQGLHTVSLEAGPSTTASLYQLALSSSNPRLLPDLIFLSVLHDANALSDPSVLIRPRRLAVAQQQEGEPFVLSASFLERHYVRRTDMETYQWRFQLYVRKDTEEELRERTKRQPVDVASSIVPPVKRNNDTAKEDVKAAS